MLLVVMVIINSSNMFQYPWNPSELYLFKANIAYALRQYYSLQKNESLDFTSVYTLSHRHIIMFSFDWLWLRHLCESASRFSPAEQRTSSHIKRRPESLSTLWSPTQRLPLNIFQRVMLRLPYGEAHASLRTREFSHCVQLSGQTIILFSILVNGKNPQDEWV